MMDAIAKFWWGDNENSNKMHWYAWWKLCYPKNDGGMGFLISIPLILLY
jgi:hypothetical protein